MYRGIKTLCFLLAYCFALPAFAQTTSPDGGSGNFTSQTSDTLSTDSMVSYGYLGLDDFYAASNWQHEMQIITGFYMGLSERMEAGVGLSLANNSADIAAGSSLRYFRAHAKYRFYGSRAEGRAASLYAYSTTGEVPDKPALASGGTSNGVQLIYSSYANDSEIHYALSMDTRDYKIYSGSNFSYALTPVLDLSVSRMFYTDLDRVYELGLKAESATINSVSNGNLFLVLAAHFNTRESLQYAAGTSLDFEGGTGVLKARYFVGFTYNAKTPKSKRPVPAPAAAVDKAPATATSNAMASEQALTKPKLPVVKAPAVSTRTCRAQVEVMDMSGVNGLGEKVAEKLRAQGYCVPSVYTEANSMSFYSQLYFRNAKEYEANRIGKNFRIKGQVSERDLPSNVDVRFIVGRDQQ